MSMSIELDALWDFDRPAESEERFRAALRDASGDDALILRTQIARALGLRGKFAEAHQELDAIDASLGTAGSEPRVRARLERGRVWRSAGDPDAARLHFIEAWHLAESARLEALAIDALHMLPLVETDPTAQIDAGRKLLAYIRSATTAKARAWEASALNNLGVALNDARRHDEALAVFREALGLRERQAKPKPTRIAQWMAAHTLRLLGRHDEALAMQLALAAACEAAGEPDPFVFEELALLYEARNEPAEAERFRELRHAASPK
jgi:tetratricopeptide (TPR) repeat protein